MYGMSVSEQLKYENETILNLKQIESELIEHGLEYKKDDQWLECDGVVLKPMSIRELKEFLGY